MNSTLGSVVPLAMFCLWPAPCSPPFPPPDHHRGLLQRRLPLSARWHPEEDLQASTSERLLPKLRRPPWSPCLSPRTAARAPSRPCPSPGEERIMAIMNECNDDGARTSAVWVFGSVDGMGGLARPACQLVSSSAPPWSEPELPPCKPSTCWAFATFFNCNQLPWPTTDRPVAFLPGGHDRLSKVSVCKQNKSLFELNC